MKKWKAKVKSIYSSLEDLKQYDQIYGIAARCGYDNCADLWNDNPKIQGSVNPGDFGLADNLLNN